MTAQTDINAESAYTSKSYRAKLNFRRDITPIDDPRLSWGQKSTKRSPSRYLIKTNTPFGRRIAEWKKEFFKQSAQEALEFRTVATILPIRPNAPTMVVLFYPRPEQDQARPIHQSDSYLRRIQRIADMGEQTIIYIPPELREIVRAMRSDDHWHIICDYPDIWSMPNNAYQRDNFLHTQPELFAKFDGYTDADGELQPVARYNRGHHSAVCNAKAFVMYDAVTRNPFGCDRWMYVDAGFLFDDGPRDVDGLIWGDLINSGLDEAKFDRAIEISGDTGVVMAEYPHDSGVPDMDDECWTNPKRAWKTRQFICQVYVGNSLGMLNYSVRFMQTVDDMDAAGMYTGREELVAAFVALRYPNTVFSVPYFRLPEQLDYAWQFPMKFVFSRVGGSESVPPINDPISTLYFSNYIPRRKNLEAGGIYAGPEEGPSK